MIGVAPDHGQRAQFVTRQREQPAGVFEQDDSFASDLSSELPVLLLGQRSELDRVLEELQGEHAAQDAVYLVVDGSHAHLTSLDRLQ